MESLKKMKSNLPFTFQKTKAKKSNTSASQRKTIEVECLQTNLLHPYSFYRPISKIIIIQ